MSKPHIDVVNDYINQLQELGYNSKIQLTNASYYGIPQERQRVICVSMLGQNNFEFPIEKIKSNNLQDFLDFREQDDITYNFYNRYKLIKIKMQH